MSFITSKTLENSLDLPVSLPQTKVEKTDWLVISSVLITEKQNFTLKWLQLHLLGAISTGACATGQCSIDVAGWGIAYVGLFKDFDPTQKPQLQSGLVERLIVGDANTIPPIIAVRPISPSGVYGPGRYSFVAGNNTTDCDLRIVVSGSIKALLQTGL